MLFEEAHHAFIRQHLARRTGERRRRLEIGHAHAEKLFCRNIWWELVGHFHDLHPEYEVRDWRGRSYFADFAWITMFIRLIIEIKGYQSHVIDMDRHKFCNELNREAFLFGAGYHVVSFAYDDVNERPDVCINLLRLIMSKYHNMPGPASQPLLAEKEIIRLAIQLARPLFAKDVCDHFQVDYRTARRWLAQLSEKGWLKPIYRGKETRIVQYELVGNMIDYLI